MSVAERIRNKITVAWDPVALEIVDESAAHAGHVGSQPEGETHFRLTIVARQFEGLQRIERYRKVHDILSDELAERVHALSLRLHAPTEWDG